MTSMVGSEAKSENITDLAAGPLPKQHEPSAVLSKSQQRIKNQHQRTNQQTHSSSRRSQQQGQELRHKSSKHSRTSNAKDHHKRRKLEPGSEVVGNSSREEQREFPTTRIISAGGRQNSPIRAFSPGTSAPKFLLVPIRHQGRQILNSDSEPEEDESSGLSKIRSDPLVQMVTW